MAKRGRPRTLDPVQIAKQINEYIDTHDLPFIASICTDLNYNYDTLYRLEKECQELSESIKRANKKCESMILQGSLLGNYSGSVGIFLLKNYGWTDKQEQEVDNKVTVTLGEAAKYAE